VPKDIKNPQNQKDKVVPRVEPELESDIFSPEISQKIVDMVIKDGELYKENMQEWVAQKELDLKHYDMAKPSELENLTKKAWQSDRNLGLAPAVADSYQATLLATCWNPDSINFQATELDDIDNRNNQEKFMKVIVGKNHCNVAPEIDDFIHNRIVLGFSVFKARWEVWYDWVDKRIPVKDKNGKTIRFDIKTEHMRFEKGILENIADIDDLLLPTYGKDIQELPSFIHVLHMTGQDVIDAGDRNIYRNVDENYIKGLKQSSYDGEKSRLGEEKLKELGIQIETMSDADIRNIPISLYEWYGDYKIGKKTEKYRFTVDPVRRTLLAGKPLRKITRSGKVPFRGGALIRKPGCIRGKSLMTLIAPIVNAVNNVFNQKSDFQYVTNCPFGFHNPEEGYQQQTFELEPGISYPVGGEPQRSVYFPNLSRSMAWAESDIRILFEVLERLTGAASYFQSRSNKSPTLGQDLLIEQNSDTRFGLWVNRIIGDIADSLSMLFEMYQDWAPPSLGERILGSDGKPLFRNLSIETLRGQSQVQLTPDVVSGSKALKKQLQMWAFGALQQSMWTNPQVNPRGNYNLTADTLKEMLGLSQSELERWIGKEPKGEVGDLLEVDNEWERFQQGDDFDPPEGQTMLAYHHFMGHMKQKEEKFNELDEEYRPNFNAHLFKTIINYFMFMKNMQQEKMANTIAANAVMQNEMLKGQPKQPEQPLPGAQQPMPGQPGQSAPGQTIVPGMEGVENA